MNAQRRAQFPQNLGTPDGVKAFSRWLADVSRVYTASGVHLAKLDDGRIACIARNYDDDRRMTWSPDNGFALHYGWYGVGKSRKPTEDEIALFRIEVAEAIARPEIAAYVQKARMPIPKALIDTPEAKEKFLWLFKLYMDSLTHEIGGRIGSLPEFVKTEAEEAAVHDAIRAFCDLGDQKEGIWLPPETHPRSARDAKRSEVAATAMKFENALLQIEKLVSGIDTELRKKYKIDRTLTCGLLLARMVIDLAEGKETQRNMPVSAGTIRKSFFFARQTHSLKAKTEDVDNACIVECNPPYVYLIAENIIANARRALNLKGAISDIEIQETIEDGMLKISITDKGIGMPPEIIDALNRGERVTTKSAEEAGEHGIGFQYCRKLAEMMGGKLYVKWSEVGKGTTIVLELKLAE